MELCEVDYKDYIDIVYAKAHVLPIAAWTWAFLFLINTLRNRLGDWVLV